MAMSLNLRTTTELLIANCRAQSEALMRAGPLQEASP